MLKKKEVIWREILYQAIEHKHRTGTQKALAERFEFSLSTVFNALSTPRTSGIITVGGRSFTVQNIEKWLYLWGTARTLNRDNIYQTHVAGSAMEIEGLMPPDVVYGAFSAVRLGWKTAPADYDSVVVYASDARGLERRFPPRKGAPNLMVLKADPRLASYGSTTTFAQTFVDLWNMPEWYASDFLDFLKSKL